MEFTLKFKLFIDHLNVLGDFKLVTLKLIYKVKLSFKLLKMFNARFFKLTHLEFYLYTYLFIDHLKMNSDEFKTCDLHLQVQIAVVKYTFKLELCVDHLLVQKPGGLGRLLFSVNAKRTSLVHFATGLVL